MLAAFAEPHEIGPVVANRAAIDRLFVLDRVEDILAACDGATAAGGPDAEFARASAATIRTKSPLSLKIALAQMRAGRFMAFDDCMRTEFRIVSRIVHGHDFYEGVRAVIIDKDNAPAWCPPTLGEVTEADVERHFAPLGAQELPL
jgi:enoyl-CoA hydratase